jgi:hypothetical protein
VSRRGESQAFTRRGAVTGGEVLEVDAGGKHVHIPRSEAVPLDDEALKSLGVHDHMSRAAIDKRLDRTLRSIPYT